MKVLFVTCVNGRGHRVRCERVAARLRARNPDVDVAFLGAEITAGVGWCGDARAFDDGRLLAAHERAERAAMLDDATLVVSDNVVAVLRRRPDALLMGSFLWSDVLGAAHAESAAVRAFVDADNALLEKHRPEMICVDGFAMPAVLERTRALPVGIMTTVEIDEATSHAKLDETDDAARRAPRARPPRTPPAVEAADRMYAGTERDYGRGTTSTAGGGRTVGNGVVPAVGVLVGVLGGATGVADPELARAVASLRESDAREVIAGDEAAASLADCDVVVCRPGMGTITDCIAACVPMIAVVSEADRKNGEILHNANRIDVLQLGETLAGSVVDAVARVHDRRDAIRARMRAMPRDGLEQAAALIEARLQQAVAA